MAKERFIPVVLGIDDFNKWVKQAEGSPGWEAANAEFIDGAKTIETKHRDDIKSLNQEWAESSKTHEPLAYHEKSDIETREYYACLVKLKQRVFSKYGLGGVPVSEYEYKLWAKSVDPRTKEIDRLSIEQSIASSLFMKAISDDIKAAGGPEKLRYDVEGELDKFSARTRNLWMKIKQQGRRLEELKKDWPAEPGLDTNLRRQEAKKSDELQLQQAIIDWASNDAYVSGENYRLKSQKGRIAPWNKAVKKYYGEGAQKSSDKLYEAAKLLRLKDYPESTKASVTLQIIHDSRSKHSRESDEMQEHSLVVEPDDPKVAAWMKDPGRMDVRGIDTPKGKARRQAKSKRQSGRPMGGVR